MKTTPTPIYAIAKNLKLSFKTLLLDFLRPQRVTTCRSKKHTFWIEVVTGHLSPFSVLSAWFAEVIYLLKIAWKIIYLYFYLTFLVFYLQLHIFQRTFFFTFIQKTRHILFQLSLIKWITTFFLMFLILLMAFSFLFQ